MRTVFTCALVAAVGLAQEVSNDIAVVKETAGQYQAEVMQFVNAVQQGKINFDVLLSKMPESITSQLETAVQG